MLSHSICKDGGLRSLIKMARGVFTPFQTNCYILDLESHCLIIDPGDGAESIVQHINKTLPKAETHIYLTHGHCDHIGAVEGLCELLPKAKIFASKGDHAFYIDPNLNLSNQFPTPVNLAKILDRIQYIQDDEELQFGKYKFKILEIPGHTPGHTGLYSKDEKMLFSGDTLFQGSVGNTSLPLGNFKVMMKSIMEKLRNLPEDTVVFPGHGESTTIGEENVSNPFILAEVARQDMQ